MNTLKNDMEEYTFQLSKGHIQKAYKGIMDFMADLMGSLEGTHLDFNVSALYFGYMDMTYFAFTPQSLKNRKLKIAVVFLHEECKFQCWLAGYNRRIQAEYVAYLSQRDIGKYTLSAIAPGVDAIIATTIVEQPDFERLDELKQEIEKQLLAFIEDMMVLLH